MAFGGLHSGGRSQDIAEINMIPLIDVMLVLLIIFIITAPLLTHAIKLDLPQAASQPSPQQADTIQLSIQADGTVFWDTEAVDADTWRARMTAAAQQTPQPEIHLRADGDLAYRHVARIMADASRAGLVKLGFVTDPRDASAP
ncbi:MAG: biopolymer transporter ExbD [Thiobacillus sp.]|uniref:ExbD/TolR family protein n=1 Tax=Thiobacillus sp. TaxID=924 RepID=UPI0027367F13|nr:biopolymer transporter ExbD [Thiobacillus sp.]MDP3583643.1 biopolymer transporter ExbD [Thiobacillus sp.]